MSRDYFILQNALKGVGEYPQHQTMNRKGETYDYKAPNSVHQIRSNQFLDTVPNFNSIILSSKIKLTDKISSSPIPWYVMIVSDKLLNILKLFNLPPHRIYSIPVFHGKKSISGYSALHILLPEEFIQEVNFEQSKFWLTKGFVENEKVEELQITSVKDLEKVYSQTRDYEKQLWVRAEYFSMRREFLEKTDLFALHGKAFPVRFYVSSELRNAVEKEKCTGLRFVQRQDWEESYMGSPRWSCILTLP